MIQRQPPAVTMHKQKDMLKALPAAVIKKIITGVVPG
jgi:hypothetical protein